MTPEQTARILGYLAAAWPAVPLPDESVAVWAEQLAGQDYETCQRVARHVVRTEERFPSIGRFLATANAMTSRMSTAEQDALALPGPPPASREDALEALKAARRALSLATRAQEACQ